MKASLGQRAEQSLSHAQVPRLAGRLLSLGALGLAAELRSIAEQNPALEYDEPALPPARGSQPTLAEHLAQQLETTPVPARVRADALLCLGEMDPRGYLAGPGEVAAATGLTLARAERAVAAIRRLGPVGVGARDLADRLLMQLDDMDGGPDVARARALVADHFKALSRGRRDLLPKAGLESALAVIDGLRPSVANEFAEAAEALVPELEAYRTRGYWKVRPAEGRGAARLADGAASGRGGGPWRRKVREARAVVGALGFRGETMLRVAQALVDRQRGFLEHGRAQLRPVRLRDVAADTGLAVSTVAAAVSNKSMATPSGVVALKFLVQRKAAGGANQVSAAALQEAIKGLVSAEDPAEPLTDEAIMNRLRTDGLAASRRTVAKHRARAGLAPSNLRRHRA